MHDSYSPFVLQAFEAELVKIAVAQNYPEFYEFEKIAEQVFFDWHDLPLEAQLALFEKRANIFARTGTRIGQALGLIGREGGEQVAKKVPLATFAPSTGAGGADQWAILNARRKARAAGMQNIPGAGGPSGLVTQGAPTVTGAGGAAQANTLAMRRAGVPVGTPAQPSGLVTRGSPVSPQASWEQLLASRGQAQFAGRAGA
jgi:hypothetical protein